ncbi:MAG: SusC/RagA family TonB-linked outer membrane protein [Bacteroidota bacterium]|nr:SusC/RagA family TonB-linked outer membrane protein [Bacteroidota bacterium]
MRKNYSKKYVLLCAFLMLSAMAFAQTGGIKGKVIDETNQPLPGSSVSIDGTTTGNVTDSNGNYTISGLKPGNYTISVKFVGYLISKQTVTVGSTVITVNFGLKLDSKNLNEVVVIGYGTQKSKDLTGSIATVSAKDFQQGQNTSPLQLIAGKVAGVSVTSNSGAPGAGSTVRIRQGSSLHSTNDPLYVIDGVPIETSATGIYGVSDPLSLINPNDIETFTILKDAASTAIYGSRASNGVIMITTKKGTKGKPQINFSTKFSVGEKIKNVDVLSADQIRAYVKAYDVAQGTNKTALLGNANTNWQDEIYQKAITSDNNLSLSGTTGFLPYRVSVGYLDQTGILRTDQLKRTTANISLTPQFFKNTLKVSLNVNGSMSNTRFANTGAIGAAIQFDPTQPIKQAGSPWDGYNEWYNTPGNSATGLNPNAPRNPLGMLYDDHNTSKAYRSFGNLQLDYSIPFITGLHANYNFGYDVAKGSGQTYIPTNSAQVTSGLGSYSPYANNYKNIVSEFYLSYNKDLKSIKSNVNVVAGTGYYNDLATNYSYRSLAANRDTIAGTAKPTYPYDKPETTLISYYGRLIYTFDSKYILQGSIRTDGSSRFSKANRWGVFPGAAFTWRAIDEDFLKNSKVLSDLKFRASFGVTGQQSGIPGYAYIPFYTLGQSSGQYQFGDTFYNAYTPSAYLTTLKWETTASTDIGFDYGFLNNRITGSVDAYYKSTKDLLSDVKIPTGANFSTVIYTNVGDMVNRGLEFNIAAIPVKTNEFKWNVAFNVAYQTSKITNLSLSKGASAISQTGGISGSLGGTAQVYATGQTPLTFYLQKQVYDANGKPLEGVYVSSNGSTADLNFEHSALPKFIYGFSTDVTYKKWTLSTVLRANTGNYVYNNVSASLGVANNIVTPVGNINNASTSYYQTGFASHEYLSDFYLQNASFLKMDNLGLGYNAGNIFKDNHIHLTINANVQNVFTITKYKGIDPEINGGIDNNFYPRPRTYTLGINLGLQ